MKQYKLNDSSWAHQCVLIAALSVSDESSPDKYMSYSESAAPLSFRSHPRIIYLPHNYSPHCRDSLPSPCTGTCIHYYNTHSRKEFNINAAKRRNDRFDRWTDKIVKRWPRGMTHSGFAIANYKGRLTDLRNVNPCSPFFYSLCPLYQQNQHESRQ